MVESQAWLHPLCCWCSLSSSATMIAGCVCGKENNRRVASSVDMAVLSYPVTRLGGVNKMGLQLCQALS